MNALGDRLIAMTVFVFWIMALWIFITVFADILRVPITLDGGRRTRFADKGFKACRESGNRHSGMLCNGLICVSVVFQTRCAISSRY